MIIRLSFLFQGAFWGANNINTWLSILFVELEGVVFPCRCGAFGSHQVGGGICRMSTLVVLRLPSGNQRGEEFRVGQGWACGSGSLSAHIRLVGIVEVVVLIRQSPHKCRVVLGLPHEVARGGIPLCGQFHVGIEGLSAVRHVSPSGMFFLPLWTTAGVYGYPDVADGKNRLEEEINFSQRFTTALTWCFSTHATPSCLRALFSS